MPKKSENKCNKCYWLMRVVDHKGRTFTHICFIHADAAMDGRDLSPRGDCFSPRK